MARLYYRDLEAFIAEIEKRPCIWDSATEEYKDKGQRTNAWVQVCRFTYQDYEEKTVEEKNKMGKELQARWKNIRDAFAKDCKKLKSKPKLECGARKPRCYIFADQLSFLRKVIETKETTASLPSTIATEEVKKKVARHRAAVQPEASLEPMKKKISLEEKIVRFMEHHEEENDPDKAFFMSVLPSVRSLNEDQKIEFRLQVLTTLQNIKSGNCGHSVNPQASSSMFSMFPHYLIPPAKTCTSKMVQSSSRNDYPACQPSALKPDIPRTSLPRLTRLRQ
ncbi:hypothetical protein GWK47_002328 [Chionoecetes opilio]|uniref:MADF domain-containing protein n=1 Tax=Chionoecetes opilio TaxID=41210 RepID=A0A8J5CKQ5_CHIOP|nr:hypothetical protein GWK47_002328 [Chionoecetes opilio]